MRNDAARKEDMAAIRRLLLAATFAQSDFGHADVGAGDVPWEELARLEENGKWFVIVVVVVVVDDDDGDDDDDVAVVIVAVVVFVVVFACLLFCRIHAEEKTCAFLGSFI